eukprot:TRINITY_DN1523_c0_g2_i8.p1 TRINITY_DN1523_c0_g2~~TRINITY_DN1523_c0_g2_i8.p1  ORF type:complete len:155 (-),score=23.99 TRINITY_DN1523_c0_g2_i8:435-899(-)
MNQHTVGSLLKQIERLDWNTLNESKLPVEVAKNVSIELFNKLVGEEEKHLGGVLQLSSNNSLLVVEMCTPVHSAASRTTHDLLKQALGVHVVSRGDARTTSTIGGTILIADESYRPVTASPPGVTTREVCNKITTLNISVGYTCGGSCKNPTTC